MNDDLLMFAVKSFHYFSLTSAFIYSLEEYQNNTISQAQRRYKKNIVWIKWMLIEDSTRR